MVIRDHQGPAGTLHPFAALLCTRNQERRRSRGKQDLLRKGGQRAFHSFILKASVARYRGRKRRGCGTSKLAFFGSCNVSSWEELSTRKTTLIRKQEISILRYPGQFDAVGYSFL